MQNPNTKENVITQIKLFLQSFEDVQSQWSSDKDVMLELMKIDGSKFSKLPIHLKEDRDIILASSTNYPHILPILAHQLRNDKELVINCVSQKGGLLTYASKELKNDKEVVETAMKNNLLSLVHASETLQINLDLLRLLNNNPPSYVSDSPYYAERMEVLKILEEEAWMKENNPMASSTHKVRKF